MCDLSNGDLDRDLWWPWRVNLNVTTFSTADISESASMILTKLFEQMTWGQVKAEWKFHMWGFVRFFLEFFFSFFQMRMSSQWRLKWALEPKPLEIGTWLLIVTNTKSCVTFQTVTLTMTYGDLEGSNSRSRLFRRPISQNPRQCFWRNFLSGWFLPLPNKLLCFRLHLFIRFLITSTNMTLCSRSYSIIRLFRTCRYIFAGELQGPWPYF